MHILSYIPNIPHTIYANLPIDLCKQRGWHSTYLQTDVHMYTDVQHGGKYEGCVHPNVVSKYSDKDTVCARIVLLCNDQTAPTAREPGVAKSTGS